MHQSPVHSNRFATDYRQIQRLLKRRDFIGAGGVLDRMSKDGQAIRARFGQTVPSDEIYDAAKVYRDLPRRPIGA